MVMSYEETLRNVSDGEEIENPDETTEPIEPTDPVEPTEPEEPIEPTPEEPEEPEEPTEPELPDRENWTYHDIENFYERVRLALNAVSEVTLPDRYMDYPEKAPFAEAYIKSRVPNWMMLSLEKFAIFESIIVYQTAVLFQSLVGSKNIVKKAIPTITLQYSDKIDYMIDGMNLSDMVEYLIGKLSEEETESNFYGFRVTDGVQDCRKKRFCYGYGCEIQ